jgi:hypothetical protein
MRSMSRWLAGTVMVSMVAVGSAAYADDEVMVVEPLNTPLIAGAFQGVFVAPKVKRPETICGNPSGSATNLVDCYEFAATYVSYAANGDTILHLPECNLNPDPFDPDCDQPSNNLCAGNLTLDPLQVKAPVCGELRIEILPLTTDEPLTLGQQTTAAWDGVSSSPLFAVYLATNKGGAVSGNPYKLPEFRIPASALHHLFSDPTTTPAIVSLTHTTGANTFEVGFFNMLNRLCTFNQQLGDVCNTLVNPIFFGTCC